MNCKRSSLHSSTRSARACCPALKVVVRTTPRWRRSTRRRRAASCRRRRPTRSRRRRLGGAGGRIFMITFPSALVSRGAFTALPEERSRDRSISHTVPRRCRWRDVHVLPRTHLGRPDRSWDRQVQEMLICIMFLVSINTLASWRARTISHARATLRHHLSKTEFECIAKTDTAAPWPR